MGWKASLVIVESPSTSVDEKGLLQALGLKHYQFSKTVKLHESLSSYESSIAMGYYNGNLIIADNYVLTEEILKHPDSGQLSTPEKTLSKWFPHSEIVSVACHSSVNFHGYSILKDGTKKRIKIISADDAKVEWGAPIEEENKIYQKGYQKEGLYYWDNPYDDMDEEEDQLMEEFTFKVAKRRLGVALDEAEAHELMEQIDFKQYILPEKSKQKSNAKNQEKKSPKWLQYVFIIGLIILWRIFKHFVLDK